jgi:hypothetical protein
MTSTIRVVFSNKFYLALAAMIAVASWIIFNVLDGLLFFEPIVSFYYPLPADAVPGFILSNITAALLGVIASMNVYLFRNSRAKVAKTSFFSGSTLGTVSSMCAGCSSFGFYLATLFGSAGVAASSFMSNYQIPLRLVAIGLLVWAYYSAHKKITGSCLLPT